MQNKLKPVYSFLAICLFLLFALASFGPDKSTNTTVAIKDCEEKDPVTVKLKIDIQFQWEGGSPVSGAFGTIFITHQKVNADTTCTFSVDSQITIDFICDQNGEFRYEGPEWVHNNSEDLIRVDVYRSGSVIDGYGPSREVNVKKYSLSTFYFFETIYPIL